MSDSGSDGIAGPASRVQGTDGKILRASAELLPVGGASRWREEGSEAARSGRRERGEAAGGSRSGSSPDPVGRRRPD